MRTAKSSISSDQPGPNELRRGRCTEMKPDVARRFQPSVIIIIPDAVLSSARCAATGAPAPSTTPRRLQREQRQRRRVRNIGIRSRGGASRNPFKLGLRIDFNRFTKGQEFLGVKSIVLDNLWQDGSFIHERLTMALFERLGEPAPRESFCRLYINNEFQGLYAIVESVDNKFLARMLGESDGYLFAYQYQVDEPYYGEYLGSDLGPYKAHFDPQNHEKEADTILVRQSAICSARSISPSIPCGATESDGI